MLEGGGEVFPAWEAEVAKAISPKPALPDSRCVVLVEKRTRSLKEP